MRFVIALHALLAALAMPVVGFFGGKISGELVRDGYPWLAGLGIAVYLLSIWASFTHLRHFYGRFEVAGLRSPAWSIAFALESNVFFFSLVSVVIGSPWAFWASIAGAVLVTWGNAVSMYRGLLEQSVVYVARSDIAAKPQVEIALEPQRDPLLLSSEYRHRRGPGGPSLSTPDDQGSNTRVSPRAETDPAISGSGERGERFASSAAIGPGPTPPAANPPALEVSATGAMVHDHALDERQRSVLEALTQRPQGATAPELSKHTGIPLSSAKRHLSRLRELGHVAHDGEVWRPV